VTLSKSAFLIEEKLAMKLTWEKKKAPASRDLSCIFD